MALNLGTDLERVCPVYRRQKYTTFFDTEWIDSLG